MDKEQLTPELIRADADILRQGKVLNVLESLAHTSVQSPFPRSNALSEPDRPDMKTETMSNLTGTRVFNDSLCCSGCHACVQIRSVLRKIRRRLLQGSDAELLEFLDSLCNLLKVHISDSDACPKVEAQSSPHNSGKGDLFTDFLPGAAHTDENKRDPLNWLKSSPQLQIALSFCDQSTQVDLRDLEDAAPLWHVDKLDLNMDTHRSFEARPRHASPSVRQQHLSLDIAPLPLKTHRPSQGPLMAEESADDKEGLIQMVDSQLRNALQGAKLFGEWIPSLLSGGIVMPGTVQQVTEQCLSAHCTPLPTPRELRHTDGCAGVGEGRTASVSSAAANIWIPEEMGVGEGRTASEESSSNIIKQVSAMVKRGCSDQDIVARVRFMPGGNKVSIFRIRSMRRALLKDSCPSVPETANHSKEKTNSGTKAPVNSHREQVVSKVRSLLLKGKSTLQVIRHYSLAHYNLTETEVECIRNAHMIVDANI